MYVSTAQDTYSIMKVFNGKLSEALVNQIQFTFRGNCFEPEETINMYSVTL